MSQVWKSASLISISILLSSCNEQVPGHSDLLEATSRTELRERFGEPDFIRGGKYQPDVSNLNDPPLLYTDFEYWEYISTNEGMLGRTYFSFYFNEDESVELLGDWNWISNEDQRNIVQ